MAHKGDHQMSDEMLAAFNMFCKWLTTPESVSKHLASTASDYVQVEVEKAEPSTQIQAPIQVPDSVPPSSSFSTAQMAAASRQFEEIAPVTDLGVICLPPVATSLPNTTDTSMPDVGTDADIAAPPVGDAIPADVVPLSSSDFMPEQYKNMSTLDVVDSCNINT